MKGKFKRIKHFLHDLLLIALATYQIGRETWAIDILQHPGHTMDNITKSSGSYGDARQRQEEKKKNKV